MISPIPVGKADQEHYRLLSEHLPAPDAPERPSAEQLVQNGVNRMRATVFLSFRDEPDMPEEKLHALYREYPILLFYDLALDRILRGIREEKVPEGCVVLRHLYNMGYVVSTHTLRFGIDISHRRGHLLEPYLDFLLTTHNHGDHYTPRLLENMAAAGKKVISNFHPADGYSRPPALFRFGEITVRTMETDHNPVLKKFVTAYEIRCGASSGDCGILHSGDTYFVEQLSAEGKIDFFIPHPRVGLNVPAAVRSLRPECTLLSHLLEMGHCPPSPWYAVPYDELKPDMAEIALAGKRSILPVWGEKIVWKK